MGWLARRYCRKHGHDLDPDPGDFVLYCRRCKNMVDLDLIFSCNCTPHDITTPGAAHAVDCPRYE